MNGRFRRNSDREVVLGSRTHCAQNQLSHKRQTRVRIKERKGYFGCTENAQSEKIHAHRTKLKTNRAIDIVDQGHQEKVCNSWEVEAMGATGETDQDFEMWA